MKSVRLSGLVLAGLLAGCGVGPDYHRPALSVPIAYTSPQPGTPGAPPSLDWWRGFGSPDLDRLMAQARIGSPDVAAAAARVIQADQAARVAGSPLLPSLSGTAGETWQRTGTALEATGPGASFLTQLNGGHYYTETREWSAQLQASYEVDLWGEVRDQYRAAKALAIGSRYDAQTVWLTTISSIANTYFQALGYRDRLLIARHNLADAEKVLAAYQARLQVGTANALDVSQQQALVAGYRAQLPAFENEYRQQVIALSILIGVPPEQIALHDVRLTDLKLPAVSPGLPADILRRRPDVAYAEAQLISQNQTVRQDVAAFFPQLTLTASGGVSSLALSMITGPGTVVASFASQLAQTIFDNGAKSGTLGEAKGRFRELAADYAKAVLQALSDVETGLTNTSFSANQEALEAEAARTAQRSADIARAQLAAGTVDIVTVLNTETTLFTDQDTLAQVRVQRFLALVSLYRALGGGWALPGPPSRPSVSPA